MKVLFVCTENVARSRAAETLFSRAFRVASGGTRFVPWERASHAARRITTRDLAWADVIAVMESRHLNAIRRHWPHHVEKVHGSWRFSTSSYRMKSKLREALQSKVRELLERCDGMAARRSA